MTATGLHHVTALSRDPGETVRFYTDVLGLRFVKRTINFDDPSVYHLYFGDRTGAPGTIITFFPHPRAARGRPGSGEVARTVFGVPAGALAYWAERLSERGVPYDDTASDGSLRFEDRDGTRLAIAEAPVALGEPDPHEGAPVETGRAIVRIVGVELDVADHDASADHLARILGARPPTDGAGSALRIGEGVAEALVWLHARAEAVSARLGAGSVHHVAWAVPDGPAQHAARRRILEDRIGITDVRDRKYFQSVYYREPGGVLFELATMGPGMDVDEPVERLGERLCLPDDEEPRRAEIERRLPALDV